MISGSLAHLSYLLKQVACLCAFALPFCTSTSADEASGGSIRQARELLAESVACPRKPFTVNGLQYFYVDRYDGSNSTFVLDREVTWWRTDNMATKSKYNEIYTVNFDAIGSLAVEGDSVTAICSPGHRCVAHISTAPEPDGGKWQEDRMSYGACDHETAESIELAIKILARTRN